MFGTLQSPPNTIISTCDIETFKEVMHWLVVDDSSPHAPDVTSVTCGEPPAGGSPEGGSVDAHVESAIPFIVGRKKELRITHKIVDTAGVAVEDAVVSVRLTLPDGTVLGANVTTDADGEVIVRLRQKAKDGLYISQVTNVVKDGLTFDKCMGSGDASEVTFVVADGAIVVDSETVVDDCN